MWQLQTVVASRCANRSWNPEARRPDLVISDKEEKCCLITDVPEEGKVSAKENEKAEKYQI